jgi:GNAT superfamily N-acetyltransferase
MMLDSPTIRPFAEQDAVPVAALLDTLWSHDPTMLALYRQMHRDWQAKSLIRRTLVAELEAVIVGVATLFESTIHPCTLFATINVATAWQRRGIGSRLFRGLELLGDQRPWLVKITRRDQAGVSFWQKRGFYPAVNTLTGVLDPSRAEVQRWMSELPAVVAGYQIMPFDPATSTVSQADVALIHAAIYRRSHSWNPPIVEDAEAALARFCGPGLIPGSQFCVWRDQQLVGAAHLIANPFTPNPNEAYLVQLGVVDLPPIDTHALTGALIRRSLAFAVSQDLYVRFEADDADQPVYAWLRSAPASEVDDDFMVMISGKLQPPSPDQR